MKVIYELLGLGGTVIALSVIALIISGLYVWFAYEASKRNWHATNVGNDEFKFVESGDTITKIIPNLTDARLSWNNKVVPFWSAHIPRPTYLNPLNIFLKKFLGIYWVSLIWPLKKIHKFKITKHRLAEDKVGNPNVETVDLIEVDANVEVDSLWRVIPRPINVPEAETNDGFKPSFAVMSKFSVIDPYIPVATLKGKFFPLLDAAIAGATMEFAKQHTYMELLGKDMINVPVPVAPGTTPGPAVNRRVTMGSGISDFSLYIQQINTVLREETGFEVTNSYVVRIGLSKDAKEQEEATQAAEVERLKGLGVVNKAEAQAKADEALAKGRAKLFADQVAALVAQGVDKNLAAQLVGRVLAVTAVSSVDSKITAYVEGGTNSQSGLNITAP